MTINKKTKTGSILLASLSLIPVAGYALTISGSGNLNSDISSKVAQDTTINLTASKTLQTNLNASTSTSTTGTTTEFELTSSNNTAITTPAQVRTEDDLVVYGANLSAKNENIQSVETSADSETTKVSVTYRHSGLFLGLVPMTFTSTTVVTRDADDTEPEVKSSSSVLGYLVTGDNYDDANIETRVKNNSEVLANANVNATVSSRATIATAIIEELENNDVESLDISVQ